MNADLDLIRRAANQMREGDDERWHSVAHWLDYTADSFDRFLSIGARPEQIAALHFEGVAVARAFLKEDA